MKEIDNYFLQKEEPVKSCLLFLRGYILNHDPGIIEAWKYRMPFYCYRGKMFCYLWVDQKNGLPYIGIVEGKKIDHLSLSSLGRARMKIMLLDPSFNLPIKDIKSILEIAIGFYS